MPPLRRHLVVSTLYEREEAPAESRRILSETILHEINVTSGAEVGTSLTGGARGGARCAAVWSAVLGEVKRKYIMHRSLSMHDATSR